MLKFFSIFNTIYNDAPQPWQIGFQDSAAPGFTGIVELHNTIFFYLVVICVGVFWVLGSIIYYFNTKNSPIVHKYLNHGKDVPIQKSFKFKNIYLMNKSNIRFYSSSPITTSNVTSSDTKDLPNSIKLYEDAFLLRKSIIKENKGKSGIYKWTNKLTNDIYIGQSKDLSKRFIKYFNLSYLKDRNNLIISRALIKYGYSNFSLEILEYCDVAELLIREQYYFDKLNPKYNILKVAGSSLNYNHTKETKAKISEALKGVYVKEKSPLFGKVHTKETKALMSLKKIKENNPLFGKVHSENTKEKMRLKALARKHSNETLLKMSIAKGFFVYIYEKVDSEGFNLIGSFVSIKRAAKFLGISGSTVKKYINSGEIFKDRYKFSSK